MKSYQLKNEKGDLLDVIWTDSFENAAADFQTRYQGPHFINKKKVIL
jgi:hypothetical protein